MKKFTVTVQQEITIDFEESNEDFLKVFNGYKAYIDPDADFESFAQNIALSVARYGKDDFIEGVGLLSYRGNKPLDYSASKGSEGVVNIDVDVDINGMVDYYVNGFEEVK